MKTLSDIRTYYDRCSKHYDNFRFNTDYGKYINRQEQQLLKKILHGTSGKVLDLGCGTGRLSRFATHGLDLSKKMLFVAKHKYPAKQFFNTPAKQIPVEDNYFDAIFTFHLFMHLTEEEITDIIHECHRVLKPGGLLVFDVPSLLRRSVNSYKPQSWHCRTALSIKQIQIITERDWIHKATKGVLLLPIHRFGKQLKKILFPVEMVLNYTPCKYFASYYLNVFQKRGTI